MQGWLIELGLVPYRYAAELQSELVALRQQGAIPDTILLLEHDPVVSLGTRGNVDNLLFSAEQLTQKGIDLCHSDRGGDVTYHAPGQLVIYPILDLNQHGKDLHSYVRNLEEVGIRTAASFNVEAQRSAGNPGVWVGPFKLASIGMASRRWITWHGMAINVNNPLDGFNVINPCGFDSNRMASLTTLSGNGVLVADVLPVIKQHLADVFGLELKTSALPATGVTRPPWVKSKVGQADLIQDTGRLLDDLRLHTVCKEANCPNSGECFSRGVATVLIMGPNCTRRCRFCGVSKKGPLPLDADEPRRVAEAVQRLGLKHVVITSVTRDDLADGGAEHFAVTVRVVRQAAPETTIELLVPDFGGDLAAVDVVLAAKPDVFSHNLETVPRLYPQIRPGSDYRRSLKILAYAAEKSPAVVTKSGIMVGVGEQPEEVAALLRELAATGCSSFTLGQYLNPQQDAAVIREYIPMPMYDHYHALAERAGFKSITVGPLVRSSYEAAA